MTQFNVACRHIHYSSTGALRWLERHFFFHFPHRCRFVVARTLFDLNIKDVSQCVMPGVKKSNDVELQLHESDATDQTEVSSVTSLIFLPSNSELLTIRGRFGANLRVVWLRSYSQK